MAVLDNLPFITGNFVDGVGTDGFLMAFAYHMIALVDRVAEHLANDGTAPAIIAHFGFYRLFYTGNGNFMLHQIL